MKTLWLIAVVGCADTQAIDPAEISPGIYQLHVDAVHDDCTPPATTGDLGELALAASATQIQVADVQELPGVHSIQFHALSAEAGYVYRDGPGLVLVNQCGGRVTFETTASLASATADAFVVDVTRDYTVAVPCGGGAGLPSATCHSELTQTYQLVTACRAPCHLVATYPGPTCACPAAGASS